MRTLLVFTVSVVALAGAPLAAADQAPSAAFDLCSLAPNPLFVQFGALAACTASAECDPFADVSCNVSGSSTSCSSADRDCSSGSSGERGFVTCNGSTTYCAGPCCGSDGVCEFDFGCGCDDPDCASRTECDSGTCQRCNSITDCTSDKQCSFDCAGSICTSSGICLCTG